MKISTAFILGSSPSHFAAAAALSDLQARCRNLAGDPADQLAGRYAAPACQDLISRPSSGGV
jgi:hypothetical protein